MSQAIPFIELILVTTSYTGLISLPTRSLYALILSVGILDMEGLAYLPQLR